MSLYICDEILTLKPGAASPLGAHADGGGTNFAIFSRHAEAVTLLIYNDGDTCEPIASFVLEPKTHRTGDIWHAFVDGVRAGHYYAYRVAGPWAPEQGHWHNDKKLLVDPFARLIAGASAWDFAQARAATFDKEGPPAPSKVDNAGTAARGLVTEDRFDWEGDVPLRLPWSQTVVYETHVRGLTIDPTAQVGHPGSYRGLIEKIPYLQDLGITAVELMPVQEFNENGLDRRHPSSGERLRNYWGYDPIGFIAPKGGYASERRGDGPLIEFKEMVKALHRAGIEVYLDMVFNHTAEANEAGPMLHLRGLDNPIYYLLERDKRHYRDDTGCGNTLNCNHPIVRDFILDALRYWVTEMHIDGFRFDLAAVLGRDEDGNVMPSAPLLRRLAEDPILRDTKLIAEAWDAGGAYELGYFCCGRWSEWNSRFRDDLRRFWRGDPHMAGMLASRLGGSSDIFLGGDKEPFNSINFVTCHDGFTLNDLVSYERKHNEDNAEDNRDGMDTNLSFNCGVEGPSGDEHIESMRRRQIKNLLASLMLSRGVPMLLGGDEFRRSQNGNNNAYCQDNATSWYDWSLLETHREIYEFTRALIEFRRSHSALCEERFYTDVDVTWFDATGATPDWGGDAKHLGCYIHQGGDAPDEICLLFNAEAHTLEFALPSLHGTRWRIVIDTTQAQPLLAEPVVTDVVSVTPHTLLVLERAA